MDEINCWSLEEVMDSCVHEIDGSSEITVHNLESLEFPTGIFPDQ
jgi:hypothetical protein